MVLEIGSGGLQKELQSDATVVYTSADYELAVVASMLRNGVGSATLSPALALNRNTIVRKYDLTVRAAHAPRTQAQNVAQVRAYTAEGQHTVVVDFGTPRTVSYIDVPAGFIVQRVSSWAGAQFAWPFYPASGP